MDPEDEYMETEDIFSTQVMNQTLLDASDEGE